jgi:hypothetical protein
MAEREYDSHYAAEVPVTGLDSADTLPDEEVVEVEETPELPEVDIDRVLVTDFDCCPIAAGRATEMGLGRMHDIEMMVPAKVLESAAETKAPVIHLGVAYSAAGETMEQETRLASIVDIG